MFPILIYDCKKELPEKGNYFVLAGNGLWMHKDTGICRCFLPVNRASFLEDLDVKNQLSIDLPKIPYPDFYKIKYFFKIILEKYNSESIVLVYFNKEKKQYKIIAPEQIVSHSSVKYKRKPVSDSIELDGFIFVGTIHSHCDFDAFHSDIDIDDELDLDGIHVTIGNNDKSIVTIKSSIVINGFRIQTLPEDHFEDIKKINNGYIVNDCEIDLKETFFWLNNVKKYEKNI